MRLVVVSPHLDDGVFGCGDLIASSPGTIVTTVFAGAPSSYVSYTDWDASAGFTPGDDVVARRRQEDRAALRALDAEPLWLDFLDSQYAAPPSLRLRLLRAVQRRLDLFGSEYTAASALADVATALDGALSRTSPDTVCLPLGLLHPDHLLASDAAFASMRNRPSLTWMVYAEAIYRRVPDAVERRLARLSGRGLRLSPIANSQAAASDCKRHAIAQYASQLRALGGAWATTLADVYEPECYWRVTTEPATSSQCMP